VNVLKLSLRVLYIAFACTWALCVYLARRIALGRADVRAKERLRGNVLAGLFERLGATFVKFGQIMSTRPDVLGPGYTGELARLQDAVPPASFEVIMGVLESELKGKRRASIVKIDREPVAAASVAQVHAGWLENGEKIALKIQRPEARSQIERDFAILAGGARLLDVVPSMKPLSLPGAVERFGAALRAQLDFEVEALNNRRFAENFADVQGVDVPRLYDDLCTERVLTMEFIEGVKATEPERVGGDRQKLARGGAECILKMVFIDGFVHADLHPGNIILARDNRVVLVDFGVVSEIPPDLMRPWVETFMALAQQDGRAAARLFYSYAPSVGDVDYQAFERDVMRFFASLYGKKLHEVEVSEAVSGMMNILRRHRVQVDSTFTVVNIALLVAEGLGKQLDPGIDLVPLAVPYLHQALANAPAARPPAREPPAENSGASRLPSAASPRDSEARAK
jgi:ubiquinone biosynthesis protein